MSVSVELSWRPLLCKRSRAREVASEIISRTKSTREGPRRGKAAVMRVVAVVRALRLRGTEKRPFGFATEGGPGAVVWVTVEK